MSESRTKNATRNVVFAIMLKIYQIIVPFIVKTIFIYELGMDYFGLDSLFISVLGILSLAELGVGNALVFSMYKPVSQNDKKTICALLNFYKSCYRKIGLVIMVLGILITPLIPHLIKTDLPADINVYVLYYIQLFSTVITYFMYAYMNSLFLANQRNDIISKINFVIYSFIYLFQIILLVILKNYYAYILVAPVGSIISNLAIALFAKKMYVDICPKGNLEKSQLNDIISRIKALFLVKVGAVVLNSVDNVVISSFLGLIILGKYNSYYYIFSAITSVVGLVMYSIIPSLGNSLITEDLEKNYKDYLSLGFWNSWLVSFCAICLVCLYQPFIKIWVGSKNVLPLGIVVMFAVYFWVLQSNQITGAYKDAAGIWTEDKLRPLIVAGINLFLNLMFVRFIGLYGILLSTIISLLFVNTPWLVWNVHKLIFERSPKVFIHLWIRFAFQTVVYCIIVYYICSLIKIDGIVGMISKTCICVLITNVLFWLTWKNKEEFIQASSIIKKILKH